MQDNIKNESVNDTSCICHFILEQKKTLDFKFP